MLFVSPPGIVVPVVVVVVAFHRATRVMEFPMRVPIRHVPNDASIAFPYKKD